MWFYLSVELDFCRPCLTLLNKWIIYIIVWATSAKERKIDIDTADSTIETDTTEDDQIRWKTRTGEGIPITDTPLTMTDRSITVGAETTTDTTLDEMSQDHLIDMMNNG